MIIYPAVFVMENSTGTTSYQFTDKTCDDSTGLNYFGARFYDPEAGRFITQDPAKSGDNWFAYCNDNPLTNIDTDGRSITKATARAMWEGVMLVSLEQWHCDVAADLMRHSLQDNPSDLKFRTGSEIVEKIFNSKEWSETIKGILEAETDLNQTCFTYNGSFAFNKWSSEDLFYGLHRVDFTINATLLGDTWSISVHMHDTYNYAWNMQDSFTNYANNLAYESQELGILNDYEIDVYFSEEVSDDDYGFAELDYDLDYNAL